MRTYAVCRHPNLRVFTPAAQEAMTDESYLDDQQRKLAESEVSSAGDDVELVVKAEVSRGWNVA